MAVIHPEECGWWNNTWFSTSHVQQLGEVAPIYFSADNHIWSWGHWFLVPLLTLSNEPSVEWTTTLILLHISSSEISVNDLLVLLNQFVSLTKKLEVTTHFPAETELHYKVNQTPGNSTAEVTKLHKGGITKYREEKVNFEVVESPLLGIFQNCLDMQKFGPVWSLPSWPILGLCDPEKGVLGQ